MFFIIPITKDEAMQLQKIGHKFNSDGVLHHSYSRKKKYYLTLTKEAMQDLEAIRNANIVEFKQ